jgi:hypothetical protein
MAFTLEEWQEKIREEFQAIEGKAKEEWASSLYGLLAASSLLLLEQAGIDTGSTIVTVNGSRAIALALGEKSMAAGAGGTAIGTVKGNVHLGQSPGRD